MTTFGSNDGIAAESIEITLKTMSNEKVLLIEIISGVLLFNIPTKS